MMAERIAALTHDLPVARERTPGSLLGAPAKEAIKFVLQNNPWIKGFSFKVVR